MVLRDQDGIPEILVFRHPLAGTRILRGDIQPDEDAEAAALRELSRLSGISGARAINALGASETIADDEVWHFVVCVADGLPDHWEFTPEAGDGEELAFHWQPLERVPNPDGDSAYLRALAHIRRAAIG